MALLFGSDSDPAGSLWTLWSYSKQPLTAPWDALGALLSPVSYPRSSVAPSASCPGALDLHFGVLFGSVWHPLGEHLMVYLPQMGRFQGRRLLTFPKQQLPESTLPLFMVRPFTRQVARSPGMHLCRAGKTHCGALLQGRIEAAPKARPEDSSIYIYMLTPPLADQGFHCFNLCSISLSVSASAGRAYPNRQKKQKMRKKL